MTAPCSRFWAELSTRDFAALDPATAVAVLPLGATEQHGPHLPLCVDSMLADGIVAAALPMLGAELPVLFLPTQQIGLSPEHARFPGTLTLSAGTLIRMWKEIGACVARAGVRKLVLFNAHGGHVGAMDIVARELRAEQGLIVLSVSWFNQPLGPLRALHLAPVCTRTRPPRPAAKPGTALPPLVPTSFACEAITAAGLTSSLIT